MTEVAFVPSPIGKIGVSAEGEFITKIFFKASELPEQWIRGDSNILLKDASSQLCAYFDGKLREFDLPLYAEMSDFSLKVLDAVMEIPYAELVTYGDIAKKAGSPNSARAVGGALNRNPFPIVIPCHRVVGSNGKLVGYGGGIEIKKKLILLEYNYIKSENKENEL